LTATSFLRNVVHSRLCSLKNTTHQKIRVRIVGFFQPAGDDGFKNDIDSETNRQHPVLDSIGMPYQIPLKNFLVSDN